MVADDVSGNLQRLAELFQHKDYSAMVREAAAAVEKWPDAPRCWDLLGVAHLSLGQLDQAQSALAKAHALAPNDADILAHWGLTLRTIGRSAEALARLQQAHHLAPAEPSHLSNMGNVCMDLRRYEDAERCFNAALSRQPEYADALNNLGSCLQAQGKMQEALTCYQKALQLDPASPTVLSNIILTSCYQPSVTLKQLKQLAQRYGEAVRPSAATNQMPVLPPLKNRCGALVSFPEICISTRLAIFGIDRRGPGQAGAGVVFLPNRCLPGRVEPSTPSPCAWLDVSGGIE